MLPPFRPRPAGSLSHGLAEGKDGGSSSCALQVFNLYFLNASDHAQLYTEGEIRVWLADAGFGDFTRERSAEVYGADFVMAHKPTRAEVVGTVT
jgi:hypothetical protein